MERAGTGTDQSSRIGVDFGNDSLVIVLCENGRCSPLVFSGWSEEIPTDDPGTTLSYIPACIHFTETGERDLGITAALGEPADHPCTARWMRKYVLENSPVRMPGGGCRGIRYQDAGEEFLREILARAVRETGRSAGIVFTIPTGAPDNYIQWLGRIAGTAGAPSWQVIEEARAVVAGYGLVPALGDAYLILRCDELELDASVVAAADTSTGGVSPALAVRGRASEPAGCSSIDTWIARVLMLRTYRGLRGTGNRAGPIPSAVLRAARELRIQLMQRNSGCTDRRVTEASGDHQPAFSHEDLARILTANGFFTTLERTIDRAFCQARSRGFEVEALQAVLLTGSGCALPVVQDVVRKRFAACPVHADHPFEAAACGAARSIAAIQDPDRIQRDYALRYWDAAAREHHYRFLVHSGTRYPSAGQVARVTICAAYDGQSQLGIPLYEMPAPQGEGISALELVSDETGGVRLAGPSPDSAAPGRPVPVNGGIPVYLTAIPPAVKGEPRFELTFTIDAGRQLCVTVRDLATNRLLKKDEAIHSLR